MAKALIIRLIFGCVENVDISTVPGFVGVYPPLMKSSTQSLYWGQLPLPRRWTHSMKINGINFPLSFRRISGWSA